MTVTAGTPTTASIFTRRQTPVVASSSSRHTPGPDTDSGRYVCSSSSSTTQQTHSRAGHRLRSSHVLCLRLPDTRSCRTQTPVVTHAPFTCSRHTLGDISRHTCSVLVFQTHAQAGRRIRSLHLFLRAPFTWSRHTLGDISRHTCSVLVFQTHAQAGHRHRSSAGARTVQSCLVGRRRETTRRSSPCCYDFDLHFEHHLRADLDLGRELGWMVLCSAEDCWHSGALIYFRLLYPLCRFVPSDKIVPSKSTA